MAHAGPSSADSARSSSKHSSTMSSAPTDWTKAAALVEQLAGLVASSADGSTTSAIAKAVHQINVVQKTVPRRMFAAAWRKHLSQQVRPLA